MFASFASSVAADISSLRTLCYGRSKEIPCRGAVANALPGRLLTLSIDCVSHSNGRKRMNLPPATNYLIILILGVAAALASLQSLPDILKKKVPFQLIFYIGILVQVATQALQYFNAAGRQVDQDRQFAYSLYAYTKDDPRLLTVFAADTPYVIGYRLFEDGPPRFDEAKPFFRQSIDKGQFVASSYYILATIERNEHPASLTTAKSLFGRAISADKRYAAAYYGRALTEVTVERAAALDDLALALKYEQGDLICLSINLPDDVKRYWQSVASDEQFKERFKELQAECLKQ